MNVTQLIKDLNNELHKYAASKNLDFRQKIVMDEGEIYLHKIPVVYVTGEFQHFSPTTRGGRMYPIDSKEWNCLTEE